jgi:FAD synthase
MQVFRGFHHPGIAPACALTIGNFDGVHRGHQAMLALLNNEARHRGVPSCVLTFEPHPRTVVAPEAALKFAKKNSFGSNVVSPTTLTVTPWLSSPGANVSVPDAGL